jgi:predicted transposase/invertase (TIGR01784 family)
MFIGHEPEPFLGQQPIFAGMAVRYLDPKNDLVFKKVFGSFPKLLMHFLNSVLPIDSPIKDLQYQQPQMVPSLPSMKDSIVDVKCTDQLGRQFIVEMQMLWTDSFKQRVLFNASKAYVRQLDKGSRYRDAQPVYALSLVNTTFEHDLPQWYHHYRIVHVEHSHKVIDGLEFVFIELPKFKALNIRDKKLTVLWLRFLSEIDEKTAAAPVELTQVPEIREALDLVEESAYTLYELEAYDRYWDSVRVEKTLHSETAEKAHELGLQEGIEKGEKAGHRKGIEEGHRKGMEEGQLKALLLVAKKLREQGMDVQGISQITGLSQEQLSAI